MSRERFREEYNVPGLKRRITSEKGLKFQEMGNAEFLAKRFAELGGEEITRVEQEIAKRGGEITSDIDKIGYAFGMVVVGTALQYASDTERFGVFRFPQYINDFNDRIKDNKRKLKFIFPTHNADVRVLDLKHWEEMRRFVSEYPTLAEFFTIGWHLMPNFIQDHVSREANLTLAKNFILPVFKSAAQRLLTEP